MLPFDPFNATLDVVQELQRQWVVEHPGDEDSPESPAARWEAAANISAWRLYTDHASNAGGFNVMLCLSLCFKYSLSPPAWLAQAFRRRASAVIERRVRSWDDVQAFGPPVPKGAQLEALRRWRELTPKVVQAISEELAKEPKPAIGAELFELVAERFGIGKTLAEEMWRFGKS